MVGPLKPLMTAAPSKGLPGAASRDQARVFAESLIAKHEG
jgi:hypothetical protein